MKTHAHARSRTHRLISLVVVSFAVGLLGMADLAGAESPVMIGLYPQGILQDPSAVAQLQDVDGWLATPGRRLGIAGDFMDLEFPNPDWNVPHELNGAWNAGYIPFVNLMVNRTSTEVALGLIDAKVSLWAFHFAVWARNGGGGLRRAFLAPMPEMNGRWIPYYGVPGDYIAAFRRIRALFEAQLQQQGVPSTVISWVFAPNAAALPGDEFEQYYPGPNDVDVVGISSYNYGGCPPSAPWLKFLWYDDLFPPFLDRLSLMAPGKPLFVSQTGVVDKPVNGIGDKDQWFRDTYTRLAAYPRLRGIIYFSHVFQNDPGFPNCSVADFRVHIPGTSLWQGFKDAVTNPGVNFGYWAPGSAEVAQIVFGRPGSSLFADVPAVHPWAVEDAEPDFGSWISRLFASGITTGCDVNPLRFCPFDVVTRGQMAVFLLKAMHGPSYSPPPAGGGMFVDVPASDPLAKWIEQLAREGITAGCGTGFFCPGSGVTRGEMAVFLLKSIYGSGFNPGGARGTVFADVPASLLLAPWIERLAAEGITGGCGGAYYCPASGVTRQQMAVFLVRAFKL